MVFLPRGIAPELLFSQVKNTMPYLFESEDKGTPLGKFIPGEIIRNYTRAERKNLSHFEYFRLCVSSHFLTCGTPVPTDVDNQIRQKLWPSQLSIDEALEMSQFVLDSRYWDFTQVSSRFVQGPVGSFCQDQVMSGHLGEWFTLASAAYCALSRYLEAKAREKRECLFNAIADEVRRHSEIFGSLWRENDGIGCLKGAALIAHNFGDLDRVMDMWELSPGDPLKLNFYRLAISPLDWNGKLRYLGRLWVAGELYKSLIQGSSMAFENHRHFALRKPKCLRQSQLLLVPTGPFFDQWGKQVAIYLKGVDEAPSERTFEVLEALRQGWERLPRTVGYGRALRGILEVHPDLQIKDLKNVPQFRSVLETSQEMFEESWNKEALRLMDDIPSRA